MKYQLWILFSKGKWSLNSRFLSPAFIAISHLTTSIHWPGYCTVHVYVVIHFCNSMCSFERKRICASCFFIVCLLYVILSICLEVMFRGLIKMSVNIFKVRRASILLHIVFFISLVLKFKMSVWLLVRLIILCKRSRRRISSRISELKQGLSVGQIVTIWQNTKYLDMN